MAGSPAAACLGAATCGASWTGSPAGGLLAMALLPFERTRDAYASDPVTHR